LACILSAVGYSRGLRRLRSSGERVSPWQCMSFFLGLFCGYMVLQTYVDYLAQHMFWVHRLQHLILHHIAPILVIAGAPGRVLTCGAPAAWRRLAEQAAPRLKWPGYAFRFVQHPAIASLLFVGLIYFWLIPAVHFTAMLDARRYRLMNWSMAVDGMLFWWLILTPKSTRGSNSVGYGSRVLMLCFVALVQIFIGAYITLHKGVLFDVYAICGRAWAISPLVDQQLGGLLTWIPAAMMSGVGLLIVLHLAMHDSRELDRSSPAPRGTTLTETNKS
jgi:putative membrane protein